MRDRSMVEDAELRGGLDVQHRPLFFVDLRVVARRPWQLRADRLRAARRGGGEPPGRAWHRRAPRPARSVHPPRPARRGQPAAVLPPGRVRLHRARRALASAVDRLSPPSRSRAASCRWRPRRRRSLRPADGAGHAARRARAGRRSTRRCASRTPPCPGAVEQGKSSYLVATVAEDLRRERCAVIVLDPKGDAAEAAVSLVPAERDVHAARLWRTPRAGSTRSRSTPPRT